MTGIKRKLLAILTVISMLAVNTNVAFACNSKSVSIVGASNQYLYAGDSTSLSPTGSITIEAWFYLNSLPPDPGEMDIVAKYNITSGESSYKIKIRRDSAGAGSTAGIGIFQTSGDGADSSAVTGGWQTGRWYHLWGTFNGAGRTAVVGVWDVTQTTLFSGTNGLTDPTALKDSTAPVDIGREESNGHQQFDGLIDEARISNNIRYTIAGYTAPTDNFTNDANTLGLWHLDTNLTTDSSSNSNTLTNANSATQSSTIPYTGTCAVPFAPKVPDLLIIN